jgi:hypothetical protein
VGDDYEILSKLGSGAFGTVWRARDLSLEREVALKALHPAIARDGKAVRAFWREAKLAAQLAHPAIVPIYDWDSSGDLSWYTMELAEEGSVASLVAQSGPRQAAEIASQVEQVLDGLNVAHATFSSIAISAGASRTSASRTSPVRTQLVRPVRPHSRRLSSSLASSRDRRQIISRSPRSCISR